MKSRREINRDLESAITVKELIEILQEHDPDSPVCFSVTYGDYHDTMQALQVEEVTEIERDSIVGSAYSQSGLSVIEPGEGDDDYDDDEAADADEEADDEDDLPNVVMLT
jgi:hypothetical protein